jgi:hypothetical protein
MPTSQPHHTDDRAEVAALRAAAEHVYDVELPRPLKAAVAHTLHAAATELDNGRRMPVDCRAAARELAVAVSHALAGPE